MERIELGEIRSNLINNIMNTLMMTGEKIKKGEGFTDFCWGGKKCHLYSHKLLGESTKYVVMEDIQDPYSNIPNPDDMHVFVDYENPTIFYAIDTVELYRIVNSGLMNDRQNFHIIETDDILKNPGMCVSINLDKFLSFKELKKINVNEIRESLPHKYEPLVNKIVHQFFKKGLMEWDQLTSMAWEGFALAINTFNVDRSNMTFTQFAAFAIRNNILTCIDNELRTVKLSAYAQKKVQDQWGDTALFNTVSISTHPQDDDKTPREMKLGMYTNSKFDDGNVYEYLCARIEEQFCERDCKIFYKTFGLNGYDVMKGKDIALEFGVSEGLVSQKVKKIATWIRKDNDICEMLQNL